ncbi:MAG: acetoacetate--CoA ligase [Betaproteobacteria bacterium]|nr:acetoacetate--CoA ligase [Betaproteobacteria bacterium]
MNDAALWQPTSEAAARANLTAFMRMANERYGLACADYDALWRWSIDHRDQFWQSVWDYCGVIATRTAERVLIDADAMPGARWFPGARLNFAENLLRRQDDSIALVFRGEEQVASQVTFAELYAEVSRLAQALRAAGVQPGDRVAAYMPNIPGTVIAMLATSSLGAVFSSCSPDFGVQGVLDRFGQIEPKILFAADGCFYGGKTIDVIDHVAEIAQRLPSVQQVVIVPYTRRSPDLARIANAVDIHEWMAPYEARTIEFEQLPFDHPLYVLYSSGTTGAPKCIVHGAGGTLLQHMKEHVLHVDIKPGERLFYYTTCGWMMWNWLVSGLASEATLLLYDGSPFHPGPEVLFDYARDEHTTILGVSAKYIDAIAKQGLAPVHTHDLPALTTVLSTGSPLAPEGFDYVYRNVKPDVRLCSMSGGTDLIACFVLGNPLAAVYRGEIQCRGLGMAVAVYDGDGTPKAAGQGELVCTRSFPSMPIGFWNDPGGAKYRSAYFDKFPGVWCHGDWCELTEHGGMIIYGRSDAVLNPGGVRIGTAEIYRQVEQLDEVVESLAIAQRWENDVRIVLFVRLRPGLTLDEALSDRIRQQIRRNCSPRHVPSRIVQVEDIPRTKSGKIVELAVRDVVHGRPVKNIEALANPEALDLFRDRPELCS